MHLVGNHVIDFDDDSHAHGIVYCRAQHHVLDAETDHWFDEAIAYWDTYVRRGDDWFISGAGSGPGTTRSSATPSEAPSAPRPPARRAGRGPQMPEAFPTYAAYWERPPGRCPAPGLSAPRRTGGETGMDDLEQLIARDEIRRLADRYALAVDGRTSTGVAALFDQDVDNGRYGAGREGVPHVLRPHLAGVPLLDAPGGQPRDRLRRRHPRPRRRVLPCPPPRARARPLVRRGARLLGHLRAARRRVALHRPQAQVLVPPGVRPPRARHRPDPADADRPAMRGVQMPEAFPTFDDLLGVRDRDLCPRTGPEQEESRRWRSESGSRTRASRRRRSSCATGAPPPTRRASTSLWGVDHVVMPQHTDSEYILPPHAGEPSPTTRCRSCWPRTTS